MSIQACAEIVHKGDEARFRATMAAPVAAREVLFPIHAFCLEVAKAPWVTKEAMIAEMRLQFWRDVLQEKIDGKPARAHEVAAPLVAVLDEASAEALDASVTARQWDIYRDPHEDAEAFQRYLHASYVIPMHVAARKLGAPESASKALNRLGYAGALARYLMAIPGLQSAGRIPLVDGRPEAVAALAKEALEQGRWGAQALSKLSKTARAPMLDAVMHLPVLKQAAKTPEVVIDGQLGMGPLKTALRLTWASQGPTWKFF
ncbi:squalene/phytoene synthase family protein [Celeribacter litoreus]|uniref:squalene/phytoene synthase family protein n=1 Tax=Celeribacter litoreus TaxID=2876714 RepID=UPI001CCFF874|nr:squalene/phytoene synthase family protein [Celeribacter litoreus]MCA0043732.1 squalene/phytoene synthase family protein [Celeribacter litoreus]